MTRVSGALGYSAPSMMLAERGVVSDKFRIDGRRHSQSNRNSTLKSPTTNGRNEEEGEGREISPHPPGHVHLLSTFYPIHHPGAWLCVAFPFIDRPGTSVNKEDEREMEFSETGKTPTLHLSRLFFSGFRKRPRAPHCAAANRRRPTAQARKTPVSLRCCACALPCSRPERRGLSWFSE